MTLLTVTTDWISATASALALCFTAFAIYDTRKNAEDIQRQVDSLAKLASTYQKTRRDEINPDFTFTHISVNTPTKEYAFIIKNRGGFAKDFKILKFEILNYLKLENIETDSSISTEETLEHRFKLSEDLFETITNQRTFLSAEVQFKNKDGELFKQTLSRGNKGKYISNPPVLI